MIFIMHNKKKSLKDHKHTTHKVIMVIMEIFLSEILNICLNANQHLPLFSRRVVFKTPFLARSKCRQKS